MNQRLLSLLGILSVFGCERSPSASGSAPASDVKAPAAEKAAAVPAVRPNEGALLGIGAEVPRVSALAHTGERVSLAELRGRPLVVYFYPKDDTPGCTVEAQEIRDLWAELQQTNAVVVGVSTDDAASHRAFAEKHALPFLLLPDPDHAIAAAFGVPLNNGRARRVTFVVGKDGRIAHVFPEVQPRGHARELVATLKSLGA